jgi:ferredoxin--NADP+ reductase
MDVARILCLTPDELRRSDIADYALEALSNSKIKEVYVLGRRGPAQAAFSNPELKELGQLEGAIVYVDPEEAQLDSLSQADLDQRHDQATMRKVEMIQDYAQTLNGNSVNVTNSRIIHLRFLVSPEAIYGNAAHQVIGIRLVKNELAQTEAGTLRPQPTGETEEIPAGLVFHSIGYRGLPLPAVPFNESWGVIANKKGRVIALENDAPVPGLYTAGWIKRGPSGVIGTNKLDAFETVKCMLEDFEKGLILNPSYPAAESAEAMVQRRQPEYIIFDEWLELDHLEIERGKEKDRPRLKFTRIDEMLKKVDYEA